MKFAAKRTWPEKSPAWEHQGDADEAESFAAEFATLERLAVDTEFVIMDKEGGAREIRHFRVASTDPCRLEPAEPRTDSTVLPTAQEADEASDAAAPAGMPNLSPVISMLFYMGKVAFIATAGIALMAVFITYLKGWLE